MSKEKMAIEDEKLIEEQLAEAEARLRDLRAKHKLSTEAPPDGQYKELFELDPLRRDPTKGGDFNRIIKEFWPDEGKCLFCGFDGRIAANMPAYPRALSQSEFRLVKEAIDRHSEIARLEARASKMFTHEDEFFVRKVGYVAAGKNPNRPVAWDGTRSFTAAEWAESEAARKAAINEAKELEGYMPTAEVN